MKVLKNFACNGVKKKVDDILSKEDIDKIGEKFIKDFLAKDFLLASDVKKNEEPVKLEPVEKVKKNKKAE